MKKRLLSLTLIAALCLSLFPVGTAPALAAAPSGQVIYVGGQNVTSGGYWTTDSEGNVNQYTEGGTPSGNYIHYDTDTNTLTLYNATIKKGLDYSEGIQGGTYILGSAIGVFNQNGDAELTITLEGTNTIEDVSTGIFVLAHSPSTGDATLTITGSGSLDASGSLNGILVQSNGGDATLTIQSADVTLTSNSGNGVTVQAGSTNSSGGHTIKLSVVGGSLTASGSTGISFDSASSYTVSATNLTVSNNAIVRANYVGSNISNVDLQIGKGNNSSGGIVFDGDEGTVYGNVTLQKDLTIGEGESLTIPDGASLTIGSGATLTVNGGELTGENIPTEGVVYKVTEVTLSQSILTLDVGDAATLTATITPSNATDKSVTWESDDTNIATVDANGEVTAVGTGTTTIKATVDGKSAECSVTVKAPTTIPVTGVSLNKASTTLTVGDTETLTATITPDNATNKGLLWTINNTDIIKFHEGAITNDSQTISAVSPGTATITVTTEDNSKTATCTVIVHTATTITTQPQSVSVTEGQNATFSVTATGDNLRYQWQINSGNGWSDITGATDASYTIDRTTTAMSGNQYCCVVTGDGGETTSSAATLTVRPYEPPYTGKYSYEIVSDVGENGTIDVDRYATEGDQVTITVSPDEAYLLDDLTVTSGGKDVALTDNGDGTYSFTMPSGDVAITATFAEDPNWEDPADPATDVSEIFTDVPANHWAQAAIQYVYDNGLMTGVSDTTFAPEATTTRAMIVSMLARMENVTSAADAGFTDVTASDWYATAVNWAAANGIVSGIGDNTFAPNAPITREQLAAMLMNYAQWKGQDISARADLSDYTDAPSTWASEAVQWAVAEGLLAGVTDDQLQPQGQATRAQVAAIFERFLEA